MPRSARPAEPTATEIELYAILVVLWHGRDHAGLRAFVAEVLRVWRASETLGGRPPWRRADAFSRVVAGVLAKPRVKAEVEIIAASLGVGAVTLKTYISGARTAKGPVHDARGSADPRSSTWARIRASGSRGTMPRHRYCVPGSEPQSRV